MYILGQGSREGRYLLLGWQWISGFACVGERKGKRKRRRETETEKESTLSGKLSTVLPQIIRKY